MNKRGFDIEPIPALMCIVGIVIAWIMASRMEAGFIMKLLSSVLTGAACYGISYFIANK